MFGEPRLIEPTFMEPKLVAPMLRKSIPKLPY